MNVKLIIGLGNPGKEYEKTYHNVGILFTDYFKKCQVSGVKYQVLKSDVFMNQSGNFVKKTLKKYRIKPEELLIVHDDSDIELGKYKISFGRGSAGHNGVQSIIDSLGTKNFWRLRIGIGKVSSIKCQVSRMRAGLPAKALRAKAGEFVLKKISKDNLKIFEKVFQEIKIDNEKN